MQRFNILSLLYIFLFVILLGCHADKVTPTPASRAQVVIDVTLFLHENVQTEAVSIHFEHFGANRGHFYSDFGP